MILLSDKKITEQRKVCQSVAVAVVRIKDFLIDSSVKDSIKNKNLKKKELDVFSEGLKAFFTEV
jgi:hypothetical protein